MKIAIAVNHSFPNVGGSETVTRQVAEGLTQKCGYECTIFSTTTKSPFTYNGVRYRNCFNNHIELLKQINGNFDRLLVYSDLFIHWPRLIHDLSAVHCPVVLAPVGMNAGLKKSVIMSNIKQQKDKLKFIVHTKDYHDHRILRDMGAEVYCIPNAIDLNEFDNCEEIDVLSKYDIRKDKINLLNVSNFFPDKGQDILPNCLGGLETQVNVILISSAQSYMLNNQLRSRSKRGFEMVDIHARFLEEIPRNEIINFYRQCDVFVFPSLIESFGIVPMEAMACGKPWVSFPVGNMKNFKGGKLIENGFSVNMSGKIQPQKEAFNEFSVKTYRLIENEQDRINLGQEGRKQIEEEYSLDIVIDKYKEVICG